MKFRGLEHYRDLLPPDAETDHLVVGVSGGRSSAYQMAHIVEANGGPPPGALFSFQNTGKEDPKTLEFVDRLDRRFGLNLLWLEYDSSTPTKVRVVSFETAARNGEPFDDFLSEIIPKRKDGTAGMRPLPNPVQRTCTGVLKVKTIHRYVRRHLGWGTNYYAALGYRADEKERKERREAQQVKKGWPEGGMGVFPMFNAGADESAVLSFWRGTDIDLDLDSNHGNCDLCFMKAEWKIKEIMVIEALKHQIKLRPGAAPPPTVQWWIDKEERGGDRAGCFRKDRPSYREIWDAVCFGDLLSTLSEEEDRCGSCSD